MLKTIILDVCYKLCWLCIGIYGVSMSLAGIYNIDMPSPNTFLYIFFFILSLILMKSVKTMFIGILILVLEFSKLNYIYSGFLSKITIGFKLIIIDFFHRLNNIGYTIDFNMNLTDLPFKFNNTTFEIYKNLYGQTAILAVTFVIATLIVILLNKKGATLIFTYIIVIFMLPGIIFEFMPDVHIFRLTLCFVVSIFIYQLYYKIKVLIKYSNSESLYEKIRYYGKAALSSFSIVYLVNILSIVIIPNENLNLSFIDDISSEVISTIEENSISFNSLSANGTLEEGEKRYSDTPLINVYSSSNAPIYLRTWIGKDYSQNRWYTFDFYETQEYLSHFGNSFTPEQITLDLIRNINDDIGNLNNSIYLTDIEIEYLNDSKKDLYIPTLAVDTQDYFNSGDFINKGEGVASLNDKFKSNIYKLKSITPIYNSENFDYLMSNGYDLYKMSDTYSIDKFDLGNDYLDFVYSNYIYLPSSIFKRISSLTQHIVENKTTTLEKAIEVQNYLSQNYKYNLNLPKVNGRNTDLIEYFLFDSKQGYCTYYASAMVLMMRSIGVPARYAEGYIVQGNGIKENGKFKRTVLDSNAHAWPEVYFDGIGWFPFEPTVTYTNDLFKQFDTYNTDILDYNDIEIQTNSIDDFISDDQVFNDIEAEGLDLITQSQVNSYNSIYFKFYLLGFCLILIIYIIIIYRNHKYRFNKNMSNEETVNYIFKQLDRINLRLNCGEMPTDFAKRVDLNLLNYTRLHFSELTTIILKLRFSNSELNKDELEFLKLYAKSISDIVYAKSNLAKKIYYKAFNIL